MITVHHCPLIPLRFDLLSHWGRRGEFVVFSHAVRLQCRSAKNCVQHPLSFSQMPAEVIDVWMGLLDNCFSRTHTHTHRRRGWFVFSGAGTLRSGEDVYACEVYKVAFFGPTSDPIWMRWTLNEVICSFTGTPFFFFFYLFIFILFRLCLNYRAESFFHQLRGLI